MRREDKPRGGWVSMRSANARAERQNRSARRTGERGCGVSERLSACRRDVGGSESTKEHEHEHEREEDSSV
jgi:hypothetical protein